METTYTSGALPSPKDIRTFAYQPSGYRYSGGKRWNPSDIDDQDREGICTAISMAMKASKRYGKKMSPEFQYIMQKTEYDKNWDEGSSAFSAVRVGKNIGFLPQTFMDRFIDVKTARKLPYAQYVELLKSIPKEVIDGMKAIAANYKLKAYAQIPIDRDLLAEAIAEDGESIIARFLIGNEWWTVPIEPLRPPKTPISGHLINITNFAGKSERIANSWGVDWADAGTAYFLLDQYAPTEAWQVYFDEIPDYIKKELDRRDTIGGKLMDIIQQLLSLIRK